MQRRTGLDSLPESREIGLLTYPRLERTVHARSLRDDNGHQVFRVLIAGTAMDEPAEYDPTVLATSLAEKLAIFAESLSPADRLALESVVLAAMDPLDRARWKSTAPSLLDSSEWALLEELDTLTDKALPTIPSVLDHASKDQNPGL